MLLVSLPWLAADGFAVDLDTSTAHQTHAVFIEHALQTLAAEIITGLSPAQRETCHVAVDEQAFGHQWVTGAFAAAVPGMQEARCIIACRVDSLQFTLVRKTRRGLFGRMWVQRALTVGLTVDYPSAVAVTGNDGSLVCRTYSGWFPAADLERFRTAEFSGLTTPPAADFISRWAAPAAVGTGLGLLTFLFFSVR